MNIVEIIQSELMSRSSSKKQKVFLRFFKTGKGQYGEGDKFIGVTVPEVRKVAYKWYKNITLEEAVKLLHSTIHEERLCALTMMVYKYETLTKKSRNVILPLAGRIKNEKEDIVQAYLSNTKYINNWDLVDLSCYKILGEYLLAKNDFSLLLKLAKSKNMWERRIAIVSTFAFLKAKNPLSTWKVAEFLLNDKHDLIHKAVGWMLREMGKRVGVKCLIEYLDTNVKSMPRTTLRYSIERLNKIQKYFYLKHQH